MTVHLDLFSRFGERPGLRRISASWPPEIDHCWLASLVEDEELGVNGRPVADCG
jgi:hypothetical protein